MDMQAKLRKHAVLAIIAGTLWASNVMSALSIIDLGTGGGTTSHAYGINDKGLVIGSNRIGNTNQNNHGLVWKKGVMTDLGTLIPFDLNDKGQILFGNGVWDNGVITKFGLYIRPFPFSHPIVNELYPQSINNKGQVLFGIYNIIDDKSAAIWEKGVFTNLPFSDYPEAMNERGQIVGFGWDHGYLWEKGILTDLGSLGEFGGGLSPRGSRIAINNRGQVVGTFTTAANERHAFLWQSGVMTDLGTLGGLSENSPVEQGFLPGHPKFGSGAVAINDKGQVTGYSITAKGENHAFLWQKGVMTDLGTLGGPFPNHPRSHPLAINNKGQVIGYSTDASGESRAFLWQKGAMTELKPLPGASTAYASAINNKGQVVGSSLYDIDTGVYHATLWNPKCQKNEGKAEREERH